MAELLLRAWSDPRADFVVSSAGVHALDPDRTLLKVDTQGFEAQVLDGAGPLLGRLAAISLELSFVPLYEGQQLFDDLVTRLRDAGYVLYALEAGFGDRRTGRMLQCDGLFVRAERVA